ncbi:hypothetical protein CCP1ISM_6420001 [Azospirillaceae bacterium]
MARHLVTIEIPLEIDYTPVKKNAVCHVYFSANAVSRMECFIDGRHFTPKSVEYDLAIIAKAKEQYRNGTGKFSSVTEETDKALKAKNNKEYSDSYNRTRVTQSSLSAPSKALEPKTEKLDSISDSEYLKKKNEIQKTEIKIDKSLAPYDTIKDFIVKNSGKVTVKDIIQSLGVSESSVKTAMHKLKATYVRDMEYKWKGRRYFVVVG